MKGLRGCSGQSDLTLCMLPSPLSVTDPPARRRRHRDVCGPGLCVAAGELRVWSSLLACQCLCGRPPTLPQKDKRR